MENPNQQAGVIDVDVIPSPEPVSPRVVEEQEPTIEAMDVDPRAEEQNLIEAQNPMQQLGLGASQQVNREDDKRTELEEPRAQAEVEKQLVVEMTPKIEE